MTGPAELRVELLLGRRVVDSTGASLGHIEELVAEEREGGLFVREFITGERGLLSRMSLVTSRSALFFLHLMAGKGSEGYRILWTEMDLGDPLHPRTFVTKQKLRGREAR